MALNLGVKVLLILICISFVFSIAPHICSASMYANSACHGVAADEMTYGYGTGWNKLYDVFSSPTSSAMIWLATVLGIAGVIALSTTTVFPIAFTLFAGVMGAFAAFTTIPWDLVTETNHLGFGAGQDVGAMIPGFFLVALIFMVFITVFAMFKGTDF